MDLASISVRVAFGLVALHFIEAAKVDDLKAANPDLADEIQKLSDEDPSKKGKYLDWCVKQLKMKAKMEDLVPTIEAFHTNQQRMQKKDINQYKTLKELEDAVKALPESKTKEKARVKSEGSKKLWENDTHALFRIETRDACIQYGKGTKWCITMKAHNYWESYKSGNNVFYFLIDKRQDEPEKENENFAEARAQNRPKQYSKIAWAVQRNLDNNEVSNVTIFDANDKRITKQSVPGIPEFSELNQMVLDDAPNAPDGPIVSMRKGKISPKDLYDYLSALDRQTLLANVNYIQPREDLDPAIFKVVEAKKDDLKPEDVTRILDRLHGQSQDTDLKLVELARQGVPVNPEKFQGGPEFDEVLKLRLQKDPTFLASPNNIKLITKVSDTQFREELAEEYKGLMAEYGIVKDRETLEKLLQDPDPGIRKSAVIGLRKQPEMLGAALKMVDDPDSSVRKALAETPAWVWQQGKVPEEEVHQALVSLLHDEDHGVVEAALNGNLSKVDREILKKISKHPSEKVRAKFHGHYGIPEDLKPSNDESELVKESIVRNRTLKPEKLDELAKSSDANDRRLALRYVKEKGYHNQNDRWSVPGKKTIREFASRLLKDEDPGVRALANSVMREYGGKYSTEGFENSNDPRDVIAWIGEDAERAKSVLEKRPPNLSEHDVDRVEEHAKSVGLTYELMDWLSGKREAFPKLDDASFGLPYSVKLLPKEYLPKLLEKMPIPGVDGVGVYDVLAERMDKKYALEILTKIEHPERSPTTVTTLFKKLSQPDIQKFIDSEDVTLRRACARRVDPARLVEMMDDADTDVRRIVAEKLPVEHLPKMMRDPDPKTRRRVAERIAPEYLEQMRKDKSIRVRDVVKQRLGLANMSSAALMRISCSVAFPGGLEPPFAG